jgi:hypothetical protein
MKTSFRTIDVSGRRNVVWLGPVHNIYHDLIRFELLHHTLGRPNKTRPAFSRRNSGLPAFYVSTGCCSIWSRR